MINFIEIIEHKVIFLWCFKKVANIFIEDFCNGKQNKNRPMEYVLTVTIEY